MKPLVSHAHSPTSPSEIASACRLLERLLLIAETGAVSRPRGIYHVEGMPPGHMLAAPQAMEWWEFGAEMAYVQHRTLEFVTTHAGSFDGLHLHLYTELDDVVSINSYEQPTTWTCTYLRLFERGGEMWLPAGARIICSCHVDVGSDCPSYSIDVSVGPSDASIPARPVTSFSWSGDG